ncbi:unnamed protein product [Lactuca virosa]|uniref:Uncharacterized protein n=1 Tax=Lactuca virosa TaxID=75947 RepID=A0AAU9MED4_9ASTR|nr:unnamed protein product [Lactuca virosa]
MHVTITPQTYRFLITIPLADDTLLILLTSQSSLYSSRPTPQWLIELFQTAPPPSALDHQPYSVLVVYDCNDLGNTGLFGKLIKELTEIANLKYLELKRRVGPCRRSSSESHHNNGNCS